MKIQASIKSASVITSVNPARVPLGLPDFLIDNDFTTHLMSLRKLVTPSLIVG